MKRLAWLVFTAAAVVWGEPAAAQTKQITGTIPADSDGIEVAGAVDSYWTQGGYVCSRRPSALSENSPVAAGEVPGPTLVVTPEAGSGACYTAGIQVTLTFEVLTGGGQTNDGHGFTYHVTCLAGPTIYHLIGFDGASLTPINNGVFTFNLSGGDTIRITTTTEVFYQGVTGIPTLGAVGLAAAVAVLALGAVWLLRRMTG